MDLLSTTAMFCLACIPAPIASSGGVELKYIHIERIRYSPTDARNSMLLDFLLVYPGKFDTSPSSRPNFLVQFLELDPVKDDTGKLLLTKQRRKDQ
jgi:hypothetical protein